MFAPHRLTATLLLSLVLWWPTVRPGAAGDPADLVMAYLVALGAAWFACAVLFGLLAAYVRQAQQRLDEEAAAPILADAGGADSAA